MPATAISAKISNRTGQSRPHPTRIGPLTCINDFYPFDPARDHGFCTVIIDARGQSSSPRSQTAAVVLLHMTAQRVARWLGRSSVSAVGASSRSASGIAGQNGRVEWIPPEPPLRAGNIALRPFARRDAAALVAASQDPDILRFTFMPEGLTEAEAVHWINRANDRWHTGHPRFAIVDGDDGHLLGQVGLAVNAHHLSAECYYWVAAVERGRGVASQALGLVADWAFSRGTQRLSLLIHPENRSSNRLAAKMGFIQEGILRAYEPIKGRRPDLVSWSLLPDDPRPWHR